MAARSDPVREAQQPRLARLVEPLYFTHVQIRSVVNAVMIASLSDADVIGPFQYTGSADRVVFGFGTLARVRDEVDALGRKRAFVVTDAHHSSGAAVALRTALGSLAVGASSDAAMHTPTHVTEKVLLEVTRSGADCLVSLGGGSATGLGKALALRTELPLIAVPTTYAGSEVTPILGQTEGGRKTTLRAASVQPKVIVYDVDLTLGLPPMLSVVSGLNAVAHAVEALYAKDANPIIAALAELGIASFARALPLIVQNPRDAAARASALFGAWACGKCLGTVGMALHHKLCHTLGGSFDLPHAETHAVVLPHAVAFNRSAAPEAMRRAARALGVEDAAVGLFDLTSRLGAPTSLRALGMAEADLTRAVEIAVAAPYWNPRPIERDGMRALLDDAYHGRRPRS